MKFPRLVRICSLDAGLESAVEVNLDFAISLILAKC